jgi:hypothetical protein
MMQAPSCHYCNRHTYATAARARHAGREDMQATKDHTIARSKGGRETVLCCLRCNQAKADGPYEEFKIFAELYLKGRMHRDVSTARFAFDAFLAGRILS